MRNQGIAMVELAPCGVELTGVRDMETNGEISQGLTRCTTFGKKLYAGIIAPMPSTNDSINVLDIDSPSSAMKQRVFGRYLDTKRKGNSPMGTCIIQNKVTSKGGNIILKEEESSKRRSILLKEATSYERIEDPKKRGNILQNERVSYDKKEPHMKG
ncbi:hypothetical protein Tco_0217519 [Tanacetum coccineum]